jgi:hypothetical protein
MLIDVTDHGVQPGTDCTDLVNDVLRTARRGDLVVFPEASQPFLIDPVKSLHMQTGVGLQVDGAVRSLPMTDVTHSAIILASGVEDVSVMVNGTITGDREQHKGAIGEWNMGIMLLASRNVHVGGAGIIGKCSGDNLYVQECENVGVSALTLSTSRRNNMSVISVDGLTMRSITFTKAGGTAPQSGCDFEPDNAQQHIKNVSVEQCRLIDNAGAGFLFGFGAAPRANFSNIVIQNNYFSGNKPTNGLDSPYAKFLYATCRWLPSYDWWLVPRNVHL